MIGELNVAGVRTSRRQVGRKTRFRRRKSISATKIASEPPRAGARSADSPADKSGEHHPSRKHAYKTETEAGQKALDRACEEWNGIYDKIVGTQAHTPAGVAVKVRMLRHNLRQGDNLEKDNRAWDSILASLANMGGTQTPAPSAPPAGDEADAKLLALVNQELSGAIDLLRRIEGLDADDERLTGVG